VCPAPVRFAFLLFSVGCLLAGGGCGDEQRPGVLIYVRGEAGNLPDLVMFDWIAPGRPVLVSGQLAAHLDPADPGLFGSLFIETAPELDQERVIAVRGLRAGEIVSGGVGTIPASFESFRTVAIMLTPGPLPDSNDDGTPDIVERCTNPDTAARCTEIRDGGLPPPVDGPDPDTAEPPPPDASDPDTRDADVTDTDTDTVRDGGGDGG
jgi:hypothetical protein